MRSVEWSKFETKYGFQMLMAEVTNHWVCPRGHAYQLGSARADLDCTPTFPSYTSHIVSCTSHILNTPKLPFYIITLLFLLHEVLTCTPSGTPSFLVSRLWGWCVFSHFYLGYVIHTMLSKIRLMERESIIGILEVNFWLTKRPLQNPI